MAEQGIRLRAYMALFAGVAAVSCAAVFIRLADAPAMVIAAWRMLIAAAIMLPAASIKSMKGFRRLDRRDILLIVFSSFALALHFALWITSLEYTSIASSVVLVTSHPAFVAIVSFFLWKERPGWLTIGGIVVALAGVVLINYSGFSFGAGAGAGNLMALAAGFVMALYLIIGKQVREKIDLLNYLAIVYSGAAVLLLVTAKIMGFSLVGYSSTSWLMFVLLALVPQLIGHSCLNLAVRYVPVTLVSVAILGEPVGATLLGIIVLGEMPAANEVIGGLLILAGIFIVIRRGAASS